MNMTTKVNSSIQTVVSKTFRGVSHADFEDTLAVAPKVLVEAVGIDSHCALRSNHCAG
jgi:hypothetical protein